jgi:hypothetical protein
MERPLGILLVAVLLLIPRPGAGSPAAPEQPLRFPHAVHVTGYRIDCRFCHIDAARSSSAGIPSAEKCMACHRSIARDNPEVKKAARSAEERKPIVWTRVAFVPDHVHFPHRMMVNAGIPCLQCHPGMDRAERAVQTLEFTMGWCMKCHRARGVSIDCWTCHK